MHKQVIVKKQRKSANVEASPQGYRIIGVARGGGGGQGARPPSIEMLPMIKMSQKRLLFFSVSVSFSIFAYNSTRVQQ